MGENIYTISVPLVVGAPLVPSLSPSLYLTYERVRCIPRILRIPDGRTDGRYSRYTRPLAAVRKKVRHLFSLPLSLRSVRLALSLSLPLRSVD